ncbi:MAG: hypothetical protein K0S51_874 [Bacillales bacterium]|jgi:hypothetical protein|nr:hypothetical protein [Bacillales bacterium]
MKFYKLLVFITAFTVITGCSNKEEVKEEQAEKEVTTTNNYNAGHSQVDSDSMGEELQKPMTFEEASAALAGYTNKEQIFGTIETSADAWDVVSKEERIEITKDLLQQFEKGTYLNDDVLLKNLYLGALAAESYSREYKMQTPTDQTEAAYNAICFNLYRNLKFFYRGIEPKDGQPILANEQDTREVAKFLNTLITN